MHRYLLLILFAGLSVELSAQLKECKPTAAIEVVFEKIKFATDSVQPKSKTAHADTFSDYAAIIDTAYELRALHPSFSIVSFTLNTETIDGDFEETINMGYILKGTSLRSFSQRKPKSAVYIFCIKAKDASGKIFFLKPLFIER